MFMCYSYSMDKNFAAFVREKIAADRARRSKEPPHGAAVLMPILMKESGPELLFEVRALDLKQQPGDVCFPGGSLEKGETPEQAAVREACEELLIRPEQIEVIDCFRKTASPSGGSVTAFAALIDGYAGRFSRDEVDHVFTMPLDWFLHHEPEYRTGFHSNVPGSDVPLDLIPNGRDYQWARIPYRIPFYFGTDPLIWGLTAGFIDTFCRILKS